MPISVTCPQGHKLTAKESLAGKRVKCPKCASPIQIPALQPAEPEDGLIPLQSDEAADGDMIPLAPLEPSPSHSPQPAAATNRPAPRPAQGKRPGQKKKSSKRSDKSNLTLAIILGVAGGGAFVGLLCVGLLTWFLLGGSAEDSPEVAQNEAAPAAEAASDPALDTAPPSEPVVANEQPLADETPTSPAEPEPAQPRDPFELAPVNVDKRLAGFKLPGAVWAAAYDEKTGRLAVTNDEKGILIYDLDDVLAGRLSPEAALPTEGLPTAVCLKPLSDRRALVIASQDQPKMLLVDAETLEPFGQILLEDLKFVDFLTGSSNPGDPYVYYSTQSDDALRSLFEPGPDADPGDGAEHARLRQFANRLGRVDLTTGQQDGHSYHDFADVTVSRDGQQLFARPSTTADGVVGDWTDVVGFKSNPGRTRIATWDRNLTPGPVRSLGEFAAVKNKVFNNSMRIYAARPDYAPCAAFDHRPVLVGLSENELVFGSANNYRRLTAIQLPSSLLPNEETVDRRDVRLRLDLSPYSEAGFCEVWADSTRKLAVAALGQHLVIAELGKAALPAEPTLLVNAAAPKTVAVGEELQVDLDAAADNVQFEFIPNTDWLPNEKQRLLGILPPGERSPSPFELHSGVSENQSFVILKKLGPLRGMKLPVNLRIGNEVMRVVKFEFPKLIVERDNPVAHGFSERIAIVDEAGRDISTPTGPPPPPPGKSFSLAAAINNQQEIIFVANLRPFAGEALPLEIQIGEEIMTVVSVDDFKTALNVKRTEPAAHSVSSPAFVLAEENVSEDSGPNLPTVAGNTLRWTPNADQIGKHTLRMRARAGDIEHEWFWDIVVDRADAGLPFQIVGIEPELGGNRAVIWGQDLLPYFNRTPQSQSSARTYYIGIYDLTQQRVVRHVESPKPIMAAALHESNVYASLVSFDLEPKADRSAEDQRQRAMRSVMPTQIVRFDADTLSVADQVVVSKHCKTIQVIAGRYLAAFDRSHGETLRFNIPDLTPVEPSLHGYKFPIAGRVRDGWVWDGVVWDDELKKPQLMLFPIHFERPTSIGSDRPAMNVANGVIHVRTQGCYACTWIPAQQKLLGEYFLTSRPAALQRIGGTVFVHSEAAPSRQRVGPAATPKSVKLADISTLMPPGGNRNRSTSPPTVGLTGQMAEAGGTVYAPLLGKLYSLPLDDLAPPEESFRFVERQENFVLAAGKPAKVEYSAPGAVKYQLQFWLQRPSVLESEPTAAAESADGKFELDLGEMVHYTSAAYRLLGLQNATAQERTERMREHLDRITPAYQRLTGKKPRGVPVPVYVSVIAEHEDGQQKAGLAHSYLVEVPLQQFK